MSEGQIKDGRSFGSKHRFFGAWCFGADGDGFLRRAFTGDVWRVHCFQPRTRRACKEWPKNWSSRSFGNVKGLVLEHHIPRGTTIEGEACCGLLENLLKPAIRTKRRGLFSSGVLLQTDKSATSCSSANYECAFWVSSTSNVFAWSRTPDYRLCGSPQGGARLEDVK